MVVSPRRKTIGWLTPWSLLALTCLAGWAFKGHCGAGWADGVQYTTGCYSDAVPFWGGRGVAAGQLPYLQARMEYPVLTGALIWVEGIVARLLRGPAADAATFLFVVSAVNAGLAFLVLWMMERAGVDRRRLYLWAAAPPLILYLGHNWDLLAVALAMAAVLAARVGRLTRAVQWAAAGTAAKLFPVLILPLLGLTALFRPGERWPRRITRAASLALVAILVWGAINAPIAYAAFDTWSEFYRFSSDRSGTAASVWELLATFGLWVSPIPVRNLVSFALFAAGAALIVALGWRRHAARPWIMFTPVLCWFLLTNKVYSPQFDLWLYPFLILTGYRIWPILWFAIGDAAAYFAEFWMFAGMEGHTPSATQGDIALAAAIRGAAMLWIIVSAIRQPAPGWTIPTEPNGHGSPSVAERG
ncbi:hypothetical protein ASG11_15235 [Sphingomonas sp. Leaf357]|uniref:hypothetical protein n=1 Tax=Sphingomonas sp. Leaf357 TaxID=1736350 RepID=UPI0006F76E9A|nr:hypothetical protein [Sphingomonas sp. Leaf357]KQS02135.1 hypothetical protein ASG11_15235 [Sphingomonas sp. Leaf357]